MYNCRHTLYIIQVLIMLHNCWFAGVCYRVGRNL